jgi:DNA (cytosine-5)-methyltransferase 1
VIFGSVCSGIEAASVAWNPLGWRCAFMSEIEPFPRAVLKHHYSDVPLHGDFTTIQAGQYEPIDVLVGGTPCQSFSIAGLRGGMADDRGNLALGYLRLADRLRPRWLVFENVPGIRSSNAGRDFGSFLGGMGELGYGWAYASLDAQYRGLAQRRERVFVVGYLGDWRRAAAVLALLEGMRGDSPPGRKAGEGFTHELAPCIGASGRGFERTGDTRGQDAVIATTLRSRDGAKGVDSDCTDTLVAHTMTARMGRARGAACVDEPALIAYGGNNTSGPIDIATAVNAHGGPHGRLDFESETFVTSFSCKDHGADAGDLAPTLRAMGHAGSHANAGGQVAVAFHQNQRAEVTTNHTAGALNSGGGKPGQGYPAVMVRSGVRRLMPIECERLQGLPDGYTDVIYRGKPAADGPRYKAIGNSFAVPVVRWIGERIARFDG